MAELVKPVAKQMYVCDDVVSDPASGKVSILNLWDTVRIPTHKTFPYQLAKVCVFVWWRDGSGKVRSGIDVVQAANAKLVRRTKDYILEFTNRFDSLYARYKVEKCVFPEPGYYLVELYCEDEFVDDQMIHVIPS
jgi:hypothetical protein